ncbi:hypothetical protein [Phosphitispora fastidiosa]|uniref:hypothetical protein n=1 Tax=Phosphitispora fastidiosa TaxID=2837202 RepID=UPI001E5A30C4|nr:hypothetical protein [Phosphitispora fastidiosa]MBU7006440.1 hypothetical protein [Phosphitispora fastidiosa]
MKTEIIVAILSAFTTIMTLIITNYFTKRNQLKLDERKLKEEYYTNYIKALSENVLSTDFNKASDSISDAQNKLLLIGSSDVVENLMAFHNAVKPSSPPLTGSEHDILLTKLIKSMRVDLFGNIKVNNNYPTIHLTGIAPYDKRGGQS